MYIKRINSPIYYNYFIVIYSSSDLNKITNDGRKTSESRLLFFLINDIETSLIR
jgi:hypothetical protein